jgi:rhodanese-related sulfurtransferase
LKEKGIDKAFALLGGTNAWKTANYPMEKTEENK